MDDSSDTSRGYESGVRSRFLRVLVVDDEIPLALVMARLLSDEFDVTTTTNPAEALAWLATGAPYDVILCDMSMPGLDGIGMRNRLRAVRPDVASRIVFVTGNPTKEKVSQAYPNLVLGKPVDIDALRALIRVRATHFVARGARA